MDSSVCTQLQTEKDKIETAVGEVQYKAEAALEPQIDKLADQAKTVKKFKSEVTLACNER